VNKTPNKRIYIELLDTYRENKIDVIRNFEANIEIINSVSKARGFGPLWESDSKTKKINPLSLIKFKKNTIDKEISQMVNNGLKKLTDFLFGYFYLSKMAIHFRDGYVCALCGKRNSIGDEINVDHIIPKSKYQSSHPWNLQSTCENCNIEKSTQLLDNVSIYLKGAKDRSEDFFNESWEVFEIYRLFSIIYKTYNNPLTKSKGYEYSMDFDQMFFSSIIDLPNNWDRISDFIDEK